MTHPENTFEYARKRVALSASEKAYHKSLIEQAVFGRSPSKLPIRSPFFSHFVFHGVRLAAVVVLILSVGSAGIAFAATDAGPMSPLYAIKVHVNEPVAEALAFAPEKKAKLEVGLANKRLAELAEVSASNEADPNVTAFISSSLSVHLDSAENSIASLHEDGASTEALQTNADLQSVLETHKIILSRVADEHPEASLVIEKAVADVNETLAGADTIEDAIANSLADSEDQNLAETVDNQEDETKQSLEDIKDRVSETESLDDNDVDLIQAKVDEAARLTIEADEKAAMGSSTDAFILYNEADKKLLETNTLLDASEDLHLDLISSTSTATSSATSTSML